MASNREMISVGIDIGTTTTQIIFSLLTMVDVARTGQIPRIDITDRKLIHQSQIVFTPLLDQETIDAATLSRIIKNEYASAGIDPTQVETGAVIITGETAKKKNADAILKAIAGLAGDFVVTVAGPHVESMIAGRGSGAASYSRQHFTTVTNIDIGGGSANSAVFRQGDMVAASAMNYGGRIIIIDRPTGRITHLAEPARLILDSLGMTLRPGDHPDLESLRKVAACMAGLTVELIEGTASPLAKKLYLTPPSLVVAPNKPTMFSGGIGYYYFEPVTIHSVSDITIHDDIGPLLAASLHENPAIQAMNIIKPAETLRATVLGASSQMVTLSGSTIWAEREILPLKNIPVIRPGLALHKIEPGSIVSAIQAAMLRWDLNFSNDHFAIALETQAGLDYPGMIQIANGLVNFVQSLPESQPLIVIIKHDYAQVLGQTIKGLIQNRPLLVIDQVGLEEGDYIDIGLPLMEGRVVPLSIKTLIFYH